MCYNGNSERCYSALVVQVEELHNMAFLRDEVWQFIGAFFGLVAIIVTIVLYRTQRRRKALSYEIISRTPLLSIGDEIKGKLQILFDGKPVQDIHLIVLKIINSGNVPIVSTNYERPVNLSFGENSWILTAEVSETDPEDLRATVNIENAKVALEPVLLNGGDSITLKLLVSQLGEINVDGRIVGVKDIRGLAAEGTGNWLRSFVVPLWATLFLLSSVVGVILFGAGEVLDSPQVASTGAMFLGYGLVGGLGGILVLAVVLSLVEAATAALRGR